MLLIQRHCLLLLSGLIACCATKAQVSVLSQHNNLSRTGWNNAEKILNLKNVNAQQFGKLFTRQVDDQIYAQPLLVSGLSIGGGVHNVVFVATVKNSVYAFDADSASLANPYWKVNLTTTGKRPILFSDMTGACGGGYNNFTGYMGIVGTPVIDTVSSTLYVVTRSVNQIGTTGFDNYLHALDLHTGAKKPGSPVAITAQVNGTGAGSVIGTLSFDQQHENQRPGLLLLNGIVYIGYASHCDWDPYHGWLLGYDASTLQQKVVYNTSPNGTEAGIWMSGAAPAADELGNIYVATGNGTVDAAVSNHQPVNIGESIVKLIPSGSQLTVGSFFTPFNYDFLNSQDLDMGVTQVLLIPGTHYLVSGDKNSELFLVNRDNMGEFDTSSNKVIQRLDLGANANLHSSLGYYKGTQEWMYAWSENAPLFAFPFDRLAGKFNDNARQTGPYGPGVQNGAFLAVSSNGSDDSTAILWASYAGYGDAESTTTMGTLHAFSATDVNREIWNSSMDPDDEPGNYAKFVCPTIANGKVYLATFSNQLVVYGLVNKPPNTCTYSNIALHKPSWASSVENTQLAPANALDGNLTTRWSSMYSDNQYIVVDLGKQYDLCRIIIRWETALGKDFSIDLSNDGNSWTTARTILNNASKFNDLSISGTGRYVRMQGIQRGTGWGYSIYELEVYGRELANPSPTGAPVVYPNPAPDHVSILKGQDDILDVELYDMGGKLVYSLSNVNADAEIEIPLGRLARGIYIMNLTTSAKKYHFKLVH